MTQPNNEALAKATKLMHYFLKQTSAIMPLVQQIQKSQHPEVRQVAAVYLREVVKQTNKYYIN